MQLSGLINVKYETNADEDLKEKGIIKQHELKIIEMKKMFSWPIILIASALIFSGCKVCTECIESHTSVSSDYCGTNAQVKNFEDELKDQGSQVGQDWNCERK